MSVASPSASSYGYAQPRERYIQRQGHGERNGVTPNAPGERGHRYQPLLINGRLREAAEKSAASLRSRWSRLPWPTRYKRLSRADGYLLRWLLTKGAPERGGATTNQSAATKCSNPSSPSRPCAARSLRGRLARIRPQG